MVLFIGLLGCLCLWGLPTSAKIPAPLRSAAQGQEAKQDQLSPSTLTTTMYGGNGGHNNSDSINDGSLVIIDQTNAATTLVGHPDGVSRLTGLAFDSTGALFASTIGAGGFPPPPPPVLTSTLPLAMCGEAESALQPAKSRAEKTAASFMAREG